MRNTDLENYFRSNGYEVYPEKRIDGSLVDYCFVSQGKKFLVMLRDSINDRDLLYLAGVGNKWDDKIIVVENYPDDRVYDHARKLQISIVKQDKLNSIPLDSEINRQVKTPGLVEELSKLSHGTKILIIISAAWKEILFVFLMGFVSALTIRKYIEPLIQYLKSKLGL